MIPVPNKIDALNDHYKDKIHTCSLGSQMYVTQIKNIMKLHNIRKKNILTAVKLQNAYTKSPISPAHLKNQMVHL